MKSSLLALFIFSAGILLGYTNIAPKFIANPDIALYVLYTMVFCVGIGLGDSSNCWNILRRMHWRIVLVPLASIAGTMAGAFFASFFLQKYTLCQVLAIASGFGYYSLSTFIISGAGFPVLGSISLMCNILREVLTLLLTPSLVHFLGPLAPIGTGGSTTMDTCLPVIVKNTNEAYGLIAIFSGLTLTILVPILVSFWLSLS